MKTPIKHIKEYIGFQFKITIKLSKIENKIIMSKKYSVILPTIGLEPILFQKESDFKSDVSTNFTKRAIKLNIFIFNNFLFFGSNRT